MALLKDINPTGRTGVFFREHETRRHGLKKDRLLILRFTIAKKTYTETFGWLSEGKSEIDAEQKIAEYKANARAGSGPKCLADEQKIRDNEAIGFALKQQSEIKNDTTFGGFWANHYWPDCQSHKKNGSVQAEYHLHNKWIGPILDDLKLLDITPFHIRIIRKKMETAELATATIKYAFAVISQVWSMARSDGYVQVDCPTKDKTCKLPKLNNGKERYLTAEEAATLISTLYLHSKDCADIALISLNTGLRAGEVFNLKWENVDFSSKTLRLWDTKPGTNRSVPLTEAAERLLLSRYKDENGLVFTNRNNDQIKSVSKTFKRCVDAIGLNEGVTDKRMRLTFHGLRHSAASYMVQAGIPLLTVGKILGHSTTRMTERYSHLAPNNLNLAVAEIGRALSGTGIKQEPKILIPLTHQ